MKITGFQTKKFPPASLAVISVLLASACSANPISPPIDSIETFSASTDAMIITAAAQDQTAHGALLAFFGHLHDGRYTQAAQMYGGSYQNLVAQNPSVDPNNPTELLRAACTLNGYQCLQIKLAGIDRKPSQTEYVFIVQFQRDDGSLFMLSPCCGAPQTEQAPTIYFEVRVTDSGEGSHLVMDLPPYVP